MNTNEAENKNNDHWRLFQKTFVKAPKIEGHLTLSLESMYNIGVCCYWWVERLTLFRKPSHANWKYCDDMNADHELELLSATSASGNGSGCDGLAGVRARYEYSHQSGEYLICRYDPNKRKRHQCNKQALRDCFGALDWLAEWGAYMEMLSSDYIHTYDSLLTSSWWRYGIGYETIN